MKLSRKGIELIQSFEGYHRKLPNGDCVAYRCIVGKDRNGRPVHDGKWTIGWGCTEGITESTVWTRAQADAAFMKELEQFEAAVNRLVTAPMTQGMYDACVSLAYNIGIGGFQRSSVLSAMNAGNKQAAARNFALWNRSQGFVVAGLVRRRAAEAALFLEPDAASVEPDMPQLVSMPSDNPKGSRKAKAADAGQVVAATGTMSLAGLSVGENLGYAQQAAQFIREYGIELALAFCIIGGITFAAYKYFTRQDYEEGRYLPRGAVE